eukprot:TRINITY_DN5360_c0_g1_i1.p1 TRINITY_DN5360_c0_g1~~TRINITY_DN5360_c0_g1_i1.p1  ORF type:complete len:641 (+),score=154.64 TRINITY_DN5360_c0_g1_i1:48-1970(+)
MFFPYDYVVLPVCIVGVAYLLFQREPPRRQLPTKPQLSSAASSSNLTEGDGVPLKIFFGSQTGTAEEFSKRLANEARSYKFAPRVVDLESIGTPEKLASTKLAIFVVATYGEGEPTDNARDFYSWLGEEQENNTLSGLQFAVFGLGNKTYEHYNEVARVVDQRLEDLGAERLVERGEGDDDGSLEEDFLTWKEKMWPELCERLGMSSEGGGQVARAFRMIEHATAPSVTIQAPPKAKDGKQIVEARVLVNRELHGPTSDRSCRHIEIDTTQHKLHYETGDHLAVFPENDPVLVDQYLAALRVDGNTYFSLLPATAETESVSRYPAVCTFREALTKYCDLAGYASKNILRAMAEYATDSQEKSHLSLLAGTSATSKHEYSTYIKTATRNVLEVLQDHPSVNLPIDHFLELVGPLQCRYYSISSSPLVHSTSIHITCVLVSFSTPSNTPKLGVCTRWLSTRIPENHPDGVSVRCFVRKSTFRLPLNHKTPVVLVGPGTGVAPFRAFIQERDFQRKKLGESNVGESVLYFGCRNRDTDFLYKEELLGYAASGTLTELNLAFSREQEAKVYVQDRMRENYDSLFRLLFERKGFFYVCGEGARMAKDVHKELVRMLVSKGKEEQLATQMVAKLQKDGRYHTDVWS